MKGGENMQSKINPYIGFKDSAREAKITHDKHHAHLVKELAEQLEPVFSNSPQGIFIIQLFSKTPVSKKIMPAFAEAATYVPVVNPLLKVLDFITSVIIASHNKYIN